jgi:hypothetical protein
MRIQRFAVFIFSVVLWHLALPTAKAADTSNIFSSGGLTLEDAGHAMRNRQEHKAFGADLMPPRSS